MGRDRRRAGFAPIIGSRNVRISRVVVAGAGFPHGVGSCGTLRRIDATHHDEASTTTHAKLPKLDKGRVVSDTLLAVRKLVFRGLLPYNASRSEVRPERFERRARLVSAIARGRQWLDDVVSGRVTTVADLCAREKCSVRQVNLTISLAFLAPNLVKAAIEGRLPRGIGIERLRDLPAEWSRQFEALGLNPE